MNIIPADRGSDRSGIAKSLLLLGLLSIWLMTPPMLARSGPGPATGTPAAPPGCPISRDTDLVFLIDASGSMANENNAPVDSKNRGRGETYNTEIEGLARAFCNRSVIPRDGSVAMAVFKFSDAATPVTIGQTANGLLTIDSDAAAEGAASRIRALTCPPPAPPTPPNAVDPCPAGGTLFGVAIRTAANLLLQNHRPGARLAIVMATDGDPTDDDRGAVASADFQAGARQAGLEAELDVVLVGLDASELQVNSEKVSRIVFPQPATDLPGATLVVNSGPCNMPGQTVFLEDCEDQADQLAEHIRRILRNLAVLPLMVTTENDPDPGTTLQQDQSLSLRQAIKTANCRGGAATITFARGVSTISLSAPLPAIEEPGIVIDGCAPSADQNDDQAAAPCSPPVTIDGRNRLEDGIVIRSQHDSVRNLTLANFTLAGVRIGSVLSGDKVGHNRIETNIFTGVGAGIIVKDQPAGLGCTSGHNVGNTLSQNNFVGVVQPIVLVGETQDPGDLDDGPNRALNFPDTLAVSTTANPSSLTAAGMVSGAKVKDGATIEIYGITTSRSILASTPTQVFTFTFLAQTPVLVQTDSQGRVSGVFSVTFPIQAGTQFTGFSATVTDGGDDSSGDDTTGDDTSGGDTSEMGPPCFPQASLDVSSLQFGPLTAEGEIKKNGVADGHFTVMNNGCAPLTITLDSILRTDPDVANGKIIDTRDPALFLVSVVNADGSETLVSIGGPAAQFTINPTQPNSLSFRVLFNPRIPAFAGVTSAAASVLPCAPVSVLQISQSGGSPLRVTLSGRIISRVTLIDPSNPMLSPPTLVTLERSGDIFTVKFTVYDCDATDVQQATYDFRDTKGRSIQALSVTTDELGPAIAAELAANRLKMGQSFGVTQGFSGANDHPEVASVLVTVSGARSSASASSGAASLATRPSSGPAIARSFSPPHGATVLPPVVMLPRSAGRGVKARAGQPVRQVQEKK